MSVLEQRWTLASLNLEGQWTLPAEVAFAEDPAVRDQVQWSLQIVQPGDRDETEVELV